jgi:hypothetical protein
MALLIWLCLLTDINNNLSCHLSTQACVWFFVSANFRKFDVLTAENMKDAIFWGCDAMYYDRDL